MNSCTIGSCGGGGPVSCPGLGGVLPLKELSLVVAAEGDVRRRLDDEREADLIAGGECFLNRAWMARLRDRKADRGRCIELVALALDLLQHVPAWEREAIALA